MDTQLGDVLGHDEPADTQLGFRASGVSDARTWTVLEVVRKVVAADVAEML